MIQSGERRGFLTLTGSRAFRPFLATQAYFFQPILPALTRIKMRGSPYFAVRLVRDARNGSISDNTNSRQNLKSCRCMIGRDCLNRSVSTISPMSLAASFEKLTYVQVRDLWIDALTAGKGPRMSYGSWDCHKTLLRMACVRNGLPAGRERKVFKVIDSTSRPVILGLTRDFVKNALDTGKEVRRTPTSGSYVQSLTDS